MQSTSLVRGRLASLTRVGRGGKRLISHHTQCSEFILFVSCLNHHGYAKIFRLGTFQSDESNSKAKEAVKLALSLGYRHIDGAVAYGNEREIGQAIKESGVPREDIFVTSKLLHTAHAPAGVEKALSQTLKDADLDYGGPTWMTLHKRPTDR
ncbi:hypothetical protein RRF57_007457 [Xylaria bambusicola]|uniref:NADP-dependent oxidoreductase domain-containing protein n=1 Tax=Xylaria bambusicola TaxID=326684 RepID=A0AAN7US13_9PEZI